LSPDLIGLFSEANRIFQEFAPNIELTAGGPLANLFSPGGATVEGVVVQSKEDKLVRALDDNTNALRDVREGIGTGVTIEQKFPTPTSEVRAAQYARWSTRAVFDS
jgi:hypothetical protein